MITKKRGRPKKNEARLLSVGSKIQTSSIKYIVARIEEIMDQEIAYDFLEHVAFQSSDIPEETKIIARQKVELMKQQYGEEISSNTQNFYEETEELRLLLKKYDLENEKKRRPLPSDINICAEVEKMLEDDSFLDENEEEEDTMEDNTPPKGSRAAYLDIKDPLTDFPDDAISQLPEEKAKLLYEHHEELFSSNLTYQEQIYMVIKLIHIPGRGSTCGATAIARLFGVTRGTISQHVKRMGKKKRETIGRPPILDPSEQEILIVYIRNCYNQKRPASYNNLSDFIFDKFSKVMPNDALWHWIHRTAELKTVTGHPMETIRAEVPLEVIIDHYDRLQSVLSQEHIPPAFFFNVDESGFQTFVDARDTTLIVPSTCPDEEICFPVNRCAKRATMIGCIAADGTALKPFIISPNKTIERSMKSCGYGEQNVVVVSQENGFVNSASFAYWADICFFPEVMRRRKLYNYTGTVILTMDGCSSHFSDYVLDECTYHGVFPFQEPPGTSDQVQPLDLGIFGIQKAMKKQSNSFTDLSENSQNIINIVNAWHKATTPSNIVSAFQQAGIYIVNTPDEEYVQASVEFARAVRGMEHSTCHNVIEGPKTTKLLVF